MKFRGLASAIIFTFAVAACERSSPAPGALSNPTRSVRPQPELALAFAASTETLFAATTGDDLTKLRADEASLLPLPEGVKVTATSIDPKLFFPPFIGGKRAILQVVITSPFQTPIQLFYSLRDKPVMSEEQSQTIILKPGIDVVYFDLDLPALIDPLRLDPGAAPGDYLIRSIVARAAAKPSMQ